MDARTTSRLTGAICALLTAGGCMDDEAVTVVDPADLGPGDRGDEVRKVHDYLRIYGYLRGDDVTHRPAAPEVFDGALAAAVRDFQRSGGLPLTGVVDRATRRLMAQPRCGRPESGSHQGGARLIGAYGPTRWDHGAIDYFFESFTADLDVAVSKNTIGNAFRAWQAGVPMLTFRRQLTPSLPEITIRMNSVIDGPADPVAGTGSTLAHAHYPYQGGEMVFDEAETWTEDSLQRLALHEIGHAIGLDHSSTPRAAMFPFFPGPNRLSNDDLRAANALYPAWHEVGGQARDIGANGNQVWAIGNTPVAGGFNIMRLVNGSWQTVEGGAVRITVDIGGNPWVVNSNKVLFQRKNNAWHIVPTPAGVTDVAASGNGHTWIIDDSPTPGGFRIWRYDAFRKFWQQIPGGAVRVGAGGSVFTGDKVWLVNSFHQIVRLVNGRDWQLVDGFASDVAVGNDQITANPRDPSGITDGTVAIIGPGGGAFLWTEQKSVENPRGMGKSAPSVAEWRELSFQRPTIGGVNIAVDETGRAWITDDQLRIKKQY